ncbi:MULTISPECIES: hypothetical protein [Citricoccus]|uniref:hypothetical protein n=1 Tax=Citricoccus TaxID=169133 RepID=UPI000255F128|nr:hypothetical protein [Citricoccus sp. CH26A]
MTVRVRIGSVDLVLRGYSPDAVGLVLDDLPEAIAKALEYPGRAPAGPAGPAGVQVAAAIQAADTGEGSRR